MKRKPTGRLELNWMGKDSALIPSEDGKYDYAWVGPDDVRVREVKPLEPVETVGDMDAEGADDNLVIIGDSGDALRSLSAVPEWKSKYEGQVTLVYIDPPFNTGETFEHYADQLEHSVWLTMMRDRIRDMKPLLAKGASVWVHLDHAENHRMRVLLDEEFGPENFLAEVAWQKADSPRSDAKGFSADHDTVLVYGADAFSSLNRMPRTEAENARFTNPDNDPKGRWFSDNKTAPGSATHQGMVYAIQHPLTRELIYPARGRHWTFQQKDILRDLVEWAPYELRDIGDEEKRGDLCGLDSASVRKGVPALMLSSTADVGDVARSVEARREAGAWTSFFVTTDSFGRKSYIPERGTPPRTWWPNDEVGHNREAKSEIKALFPGSNPFSTPKPERLLERVLLIGSHPGDLVLDFFGGSGTTAAVAQKMRRRWITVELRDSTAQKFTIPRLAKVVAGEDLGGITTKTERVAVDALPEGLAPEDAQKFTTFLTKVAKGLDGLDPATIKALKAATKTSKVTTTQWEGGGGFTVARVGASMYEVDDSDGTVYLSPKATNGTWSKAVAGQKGFTLTPRNKVFAGKRGRQRLAVIDGVVDEDVVTAVVDSLAAGERAVIVGKAVLPGARELLETRSPGSRIQQAPDDLFPKDTVK